jgi:hypothetical protein
MFNVLSLFSTLNALIFIMVDNVRVTNSTLLPHFYYLREQRCRLILLEHRFCGLLKTMLLIAIHCEESCMFLWMRNSLSAISTILSVPMIYVSVWFYGNGI